MNGQQLKNSILQMAVQGKLVPQDPNDEPASVLLERIRKEKQKLIKEGKIKKEKNPSYIFRGADNLPYEKVGENEPVCIAEDVPFEIPESWEWTKIESISMPVGNKTNQILAKEILNQGKIPVVSQGKELIDGYCNNEDKKINVLPLVMFGDHTRNVKYIDFEFVIGADGTKFHKIIICNTKYVYYWMLYTSETLRNRGYARHYSLLKKCYIPLPPLNEQYRIVNKIKKLEPFLEKYARAEKQLNNLNVQFPDILKKSILQDAVQGKLVPQDPSDEPASVLLGRIRTEKEQLIKEGKIKRDKHESVIFRRDNSYYEKLDGIERCIDDEIPFEIPDNWEWTRLGFVSTYKETKKKIKAQDASPLIWQLDLEDIEKGGHIIERKTAGERKATGDKIFFESGNILYSKLRPYLLKVLVAPADGICTPEIVPFTLYGDIFSEYVVIFLKSSYVNDLINSATYGVKMPRVGTQTMVDLLLPLPPLNEQHRIVKKAEDALSYIGK